MDAALAELGRKIVRRVFVVQIGLIVAMLLLVLVSFGLDLAYGAEKTFAFDFWFAFLCGCLGSSLSLLTRIRSDESILRAAGRSWVETLMPLLYGGILAGVAYLLFASGILSGSTGEGLLATNLFPTFKFETLVDGNLVMAFLRSHPATVPDIGKLLVWSFLAGYSEKFVVGVLDQLGQRSETA